MAEILKSDCIAFDVVVNETGITRVTINGYLNALNIPKHKFPFDRKLYITKTDYGRLKDFIRDKS